MSNHGLNIELSLTHFPNDVCTAALDCPVPPGYQGFLTITLKHLPVTGPQYARIKCDELGKTSQQGTRSRSIYVQQSVTMPSIGIVFPLHFFQLGQLYRNHRSIKAVRAKFLPMSFTDGQSAPGVPLADSERWTPSELPTAYKIQKEPLVLSAAVLITSTTGRPNFILCLGSITELTVGFDVAHESSVEAGHLQPDSDSFPALSKLQETFDPKPGGTSVDTDGFDVRVDFEESNTGSAKFYTVNLKIGMREISSRRGPQGPASSQAPLMMAKSLAKFGFNIRSPKRP